MTVSFKTEMALPERNVSTFPIVASPSNCFLISLEEGEVVSEGDESEVREVLNPGPASQNKPLKEFHSFTAANFVGRERVMHEVCRGAVLQISGFSCFLTFFAEEV